MCNFWRHLKERHNTLSFWMPRVPEVIANAPRISEPLPFSDQFRFAPQQLTKLKKPSFLKELPSLGAVGSENMILGCTPLLCSSPQSRNAKTFNNKPLSYPFQGLRPSAHHTQKTDLILYTPQSFEGFRFPLVIWCIAIKMFDPLLKEPERFFITLGIERSFPC